MKKIINGLKYWGQLLLLPLYWLSFLMPRDKKIWLFGSTFGRRFADNPRYLYLYVSQHSKCASDKVRQQVKKWKEEGGEWQEDSECTNLRPIWISHNKEIVSFLTNQGYEAYYYHSLKGVWYALRGGVYLYDNYSKDINFWQSGGALKVNLWHGIPLKKIQHDNRFDKFRHPKNIWEKIYNFPRNLSDEKPSDYVLSPSKAMRDIFASAFQTENVIVSGYPRWYGMLNYGIYNLYSDMEKKLLDKIQYQVEQNKDSKVIYYMPTFRESENVFFKVMNLKTFQCFLEQNHYIFCVKLHPKSKLKNQFQKIEQDNILIIDADVDPYVFVAVSDLLVTDYSSIYFDYLHIGKPILFFDYDRQNYLSQSREMYFSYEEVTPGEKVEDQSGLEQALKNVLSGQDNYKEKRERLREKMSEVDVQNLLK